MIKAIIFDFDGTLSNRQRNAYGVFKDYYRQFFKDMSDIEFEAVIQDMLTDDMNGTCNCKFRLPPFRAKYDKYLPADFEEKFIEFYYEYMWKYTVLKDETLEVLKELKGKYKMAILSNGQSKSQHDKIDNLHIGKYFDDILVSGDVGVNKPNREVFDIMAERIGVKNEECLFVGDVFSSDILGAIRADMVPCWIMVDEDRPADFYKGIRITNLKELFKVLEDLNR